MGSIFQDGGRSLDIGNLDIGFSEEGLKEYRSKLNDVLIIQTEEVLKNVSDIETAINDGWQGRSRDVFMEQFGNTIEEIIKDLKLEYEDLDNRFTEIQDNYYKQDEELMNS